MSLMNKTFKNFNLHIEKASGKNSFVASVRDENRTVLASNTFRHEISASILTMLEDTMGANVKENAKQIRKFGRSLFSSVFQGPVHRVLGELPALLLTKNIPAVIAMQHSVTDRSAINLARTFYPGIGKGLPLDRSLTNTRRALLSGKNEGMVDFGTPVLYGEPDRLNPKA